MKKLLTTLIVILLTASVFHAQDNSWKGPSVDFKHGNLKVSENKHFLVFDDGTPFFYLGDTGWELFHRLNKEETEKYLENRRAKGYTVIQAVVLAELNGLNSPNAEGNRPLLNNNPLTPDEKYFAHVDWVIKKAEEKGIFIGVLPTWGDKWNRKWGEGPQIFNPDNAKAYGKFIGQRYKNNPNIIWIVGGDRPVETEIQRQTVVAMAEGLREGDGGRHLISFHPTGGNGSSQYFHNEPWLDFNMRQNGHSQSYTERYYATSEDYRLDPPKPVIDAEPIYEDHPVNFNPDQNGHSTATDVRRPLYWDLFSGAFGHTYGHHSVWQMWSPGRNPVNRPLMPWYEAIDQPGAGQMVFGRMLMESRPFITRIPDNSIIVPDNITSSVPGAGSYRFVATRDQEGTYAMVYVPVGRKFSVRMDVIKGKDIVAWWFNPRNGEAKEIGKFTNTGTQSFNAPAPGENLDWILVLDDASKKYPAPGTKK
ncbi:MAG: glycoside hydrolase family 140 protein [Bacteroidales bacterium]|nr:glycoside hydrolase family 140 protein [Bacteroidales bacterium]